MTPVSVFVFTVSVGIPSQQMAPSAQNLGNIDPNIRRAVAEPYEQAFGQVVEKFGLARLPGCDDLQAGCVYRYDGFTPG